MRKQSQKVNSYHFWLAWSLSACDESFPRKQINSTNNKGMNNCNPTNVGHLKKPFFWRGSYEEKTLVYIIYCRKTSHYFGQLYRCLRDKWDNVHHKYDIPSICNEISFFLFWLTFPQFLLLVNFLYYFLTTMSSKAVSKYWKYWYMFCRCFKALGRIMSFEDSNFWLFFE